MDITGLPIELYQSILEFLHLPDVLRLRLVSKFFREVVREFRVYEIEFLGLYGGGFVERSSVDLFNHGYGMSRWFDSYSSIQIRSSAVNDFKNFIPTNLLDHRKQHLLAEPLFNIRGLKKLKVGFLVGPFYLSDTHINQLTHLEELQICFRQDYSAQNVKPLVDPKFRICPFSPMLSWKLSLPKLKVLHLQRSTMWPFNLQVVAPRLHSFGLHFDSMEDVFRFEHPESVRRLEVDLLWYENGLFSFFNLEELSVDNLLGGDEKVFSAFPRLKTLKLKLNNRNDREIISKTQISLDKYLTRFVLDRNLQIFCHGFRIADRQTIDRFFANFPPSSFYYSRYPSENKPIAKFVKFFIENLEEIEDDLNAPPLIDCQMVYKWFGQEDERPIPIDLILAKFGRLQAISISSKIKYPNRLLQFLAGCKRLGKLHIENAQLSQAFFDELPSITSLCYLQIYEFQALNFRFIHRMFRLKRLCSNHLLLTAIRKGNLALARFAGIEFRYIGNTSYYDGFDCFVYRNEDPPESWNLKANLYNYRYRPVGEPNFCIERAYPIKKMNNKKFFKFFDSLTENVYAPLSICPILWMLYEAHSDLQAKMQILFFIHFDDHNLITLCVQWIQIEIKSSCASEHHDDWTDCNHMLSRAFLCLRPGLFIWSPDSGLWGMVCEFRDWMSLSIFVFGQVNTFYIFNQLTSLGRCFALPINRENLIELTNRVELISSSLRN